MDRRTNAPRAVGVLMACAVSIAALQPVYAEDTTPNTADTSEDFVVTLLGTGGPDPILTRFGPSTLVQVSGQTLVFDAGRGAMQRIKHLGIVPAKIDHIFLTHFHSDHTIGLPDLWLIPWLPPQGRREDPRTITGPVGTKQLTEGLSLAYADDHRIRIADAGLDPVGVEWDVTEFAQDGPVYEQDGVVVSAFENFHGPALKPSYGYRIDYDGRSVAISGDTKPFDNVVRHSTGVDLLIHEVAMAAPAVAENARIRIIMNHHTSPTEAAEVFSKAQPKVAAFTHFVFLGQGANRPDADDVIAQTTAGYDGSVIAGEDLMSFVIGDTVEIIQPEDN